VGEVCRRARERPSTRMLRCPESIERDERRGFRPRFPTAPSHGIGRRCGTGRPGCAGEGKGRHPEEGRAQSLKGRESRQ
jgi:hypothetical protein